MNTNLSFCINFSGITARFSLPTQVTLPDSLKELMCECPEKADVEYTISLISHPLNPQGVLVFNDRSIKVYKTPQGYLRIYNPLTAEDGCQVACLISPHGENVMYYPASEWEEYRKYWHVNHLLCGEEMLRHMDALLLHSSLVMINGHTVLFSGESGAGKSTQANLWREHLGAEILNGDRTVIRKKGDKFYGGSSIWSGTSEIFSPKEAPIKGIFLLKKGTENSVRKMGADAFPRLFSETTLNSWNTEFMDKITSIHTELIEKIPIYELTCRMDKEAAELGYNTLFSKEEAV